MSDMSPEMQNTSQGDQENKLMSEQFDELKEALEVLYMIANLGGRLQFAKAWPAAAARVLGAELSKYDEDGALDKERKAELEIEAEERRIELLEFMDTLEESSVKDGALQIDYVRESVMDLGRDLALCIYGSKLVDRFISPPSMLEPEVEDDEVEFSPDPVPVVEPSVQNESAEGPDILADEDSLSVVKPIDVVQPAVPQSPPVEQNSEVKNSEAKPSVSMTFISSKKPEDDSGTPPVE